MRKLLIFWTLTTAMLLVAAWSTLSVPHMDTTFPFPARAVIATDSYGLDAIDFQEVFPDRDIVQFHDGTLGHVCIATTPRGEKHFVLSMPEDYRSGRCVL